MGAGQDIQPYRAEPYVDAFHRQGLQKWCAAGLGSNNNGCMNIQLNQLYLDLPSGYLI